MKKTGRALCNSGYQIKDPTENCSTWRRGRIKKYSANCHFCLPIRTLATHATNSESHPFFLLDAESHLNKAQSHETTAPN
jgi:hypothetical protein